MKAKLMIKVAIICWPGLPHSEDMSMDIGRKMISRGKVLTENCIHSCVVHKCIYTILELKLDLATSYDMAYKYGMLCYFRHVCNSAVPIKIVPSLCPSIYVHENENG
jgi:hypothetical protein